MKRLICAVSLLSALSCTNEERSTRQELSGSDSAQALSPPTSLSATESSSANSKLKNSTGGVAIKWAYEKKVDKEGNTVYKAAINSPTVLNFDFPYEGGSTATLTIRQKNDVSYVYLEVSKGQFNRSFQGGNASIRFDDKPPVRYSLSAAENGRANIVFFDSPQKLINQLKGAQKMIVDVEFHGQGTRHIEFLTSGLSWNH
ncbi:hypothetical protein [Spirosoma lituiforme]